MVLWVAEALLDMTRSKTVTTQQPPAIHCPASNVPADQKKRSALDIGTTKSLHALISCGAGRGAHFPLTPSKQNIAHHLHRII